jgi:YHS domain-containing protein
VTLRVIILFVLVLLAIRAVRLLIGGIASGAGLGPGRDGTGSRRAAPTKLVRDPVCGTHVAPRPALSVTADGTTHYFCSEECRGRFKA